MARIKNQKPSRQHKEPAPSGAGRGTGPKEIAFSVRLTADEHERLRNAAALRGWKPTNLIRTAALEKATHILNTSQVRSINFKGLAVRIADQLFKPRTYEVKLAVDEDRTYTVQMNENELDSLPDDASVVAVRPEIEAFPVDALGELKMAVKYGGGEFLNQILEYCEGLTASRRSDVPPLIDPPSSL